MFKFKNLKSILILTFICTFVTLSTSISSAERYIIDKDHSEITFSVRHLMISTVKGHFRDFEGAILWDRDFPKQSTFEGVIKALTIDTNNSDRDQHLKSADFLFANKYPLITFTSTKVISSKEGLKVIADLTIRGVTKRVTFPLIVNGPITDLGDNKRLGFEGTFSINRKDFGLKWNKKLREDKGFLVGDQVDITFSLSAKRIR